MNCLFRHIVGPVRTLIHPNKEVGARSTLAAIDRMVCIDEGRGDGVGS